MKAIWQLLGAAIASWSEDKAPRLGAALAYYTVFSLAPLLVIAVGIAGVFFGEEAARGQIVDQIRGLVGDQGAQAVETMVEHAGRQKTSGVVATAIGLAMLLFGASGVFGELQDSLNTIWGVKPRPGRGLLGVIKDRFASFTMVIGIAFLLLVSLILSAALAALGPRLGGGTAEGAMHIVNGLVSFGVITVLFAAMYKYVPDVQIQWRDVWVGAAVTSLLFTLGKFAIGLYLGKSSVASAYGAAGSLVILLIWVYYSAQILFFGAEFTKVYAKSYGSGLRPAPDAIPVTPEARAEQGLGPGVATPFATEQGRHGPTSTAPDITPQASLIFALGALLGFALGRTPLRLLVKHGPRAISLAIRVTGVVTALGRYRDRRRGGGGVAARRGTQGGRDMNATTFLTQEDGEVRDLVKGVRRTTGTPRGAGVAVMAKAGHR
jgi:membrane protein